MAISRQKYNQWLRRLVVTVAGLLGLWALAWALVPPILKSQAEKIAGEELGRKVTIGKVDFKPWSLELTVNDLVVATADGAAEQFKISRLYIDGELQSLLRLAPVVDAIQVDAPVARLTHLGGGQYDIDDIMARVTRPTAKPPGEPTRFALYNLALAGGAVDFTDKAVGKTHTLRDLKFSVPFLSNLASQREVRVEPHLAFNLNGSAFDSAAQGTPFTQTRKIDATLKIAALDLKPYLGYIPAELPVKLLAAVLNADLKLAFEQAPRPAVKLSGTVQAGAVKLVDRQSQELLAFDALKLALDDVRPLEKAVSLSSVELVAPVVTARRDRSGRINLALDAPVPAQASGRAAAAKIAATDATKIVANNDQQKRTKALKDAENPTGAASAAATAKAPAASSTAGTTAAVTQPNSPSGQSGATPWAVKVAKLAVRNGRVNWTDETLSRPAQLAATDVVLDATAIALPFANPLQFSGTARLMAAGAGAGAGGPPATPASAGTATVAAAPSGSAELTFSGQATDRAATATATLATLPLALAAPYLADLIEPTLGGSLAAQIGVVWEAAGAAGASSGGAGATRPAAAPAAAAGPAAAPGVSGATGRAAATAATVRLNVQQLVLDNLSLAQGKTALASVKKVEVANALVDLTQQSVTVGRLAVTAPRARVERDEDQRWMFERWMKGADKGGDKAGQKGAPKLAPVAAPPTAVSKPATPAAPSSPTSPAWRVLLEDLAIEGGAVSFSDRALARPVAVELSSIKLQMKNFTPDGRKPAPLNLSARVGAGQTEPGRLDWRGTLAMVPLAAAGQLQAASLPVHAFEPYFGDLLNIELLRADASFKGQVRYTDSAAGPVVKIIGDTSLEEFRANSIASAAGAGTPSAVADPAANAFGVAKPAAPGAGPRAGVLRVSEELLSWKTLSLRGLDVSVSPGSVTTVDVKETVLSDFFARVIINEGGRINLQDITKASAAAGTASAAVTPAPPLPAAAVPVGRPQNAEGGGPPIATNSITNNDRATRTTGQKGTQTGNQTAATPASGPEPLITIGPVSLVNGKVFFSDRFVRPNYSANLSELTGKLSAFSSVSPDGSPQLADLELRGRAEGTASLEILGKLNPLAKPLALDIKGKVRDLELPPLSPYSVKYAGHGIERGKMSVDVSYVVLPNGQLTASNNVVLNQLTFGEKVEGAPASLPVRLAVALLADRNGVIDINLPISGSLNDPQFSLGPIIFKVIVNLIVKAITSPFSLLAAAFGGGGDELSMVAFAPGSAVLAADARAGLDKVAKALTDRPALKLTVVGTASLEVERDGYQRERLKALVDAEKRRTAVVAGQTATATVSVSDAEYPALLKEVYKRADIPKPRNVVGLAKDLPAAEMEALLLANIPVNEDLMRELALQRGVAVKDYLSSKQLPVERLFLGAAKAVAVASPAGSAGSAAGSATSTSGAGGAPAPATGGPAGSITEAKWSPRAELNLVSD